VSPLTDLFRRLAEEYLASFPTARERRPVVDIMRTFLRDDSDVKKLSERKRTALLTGPIDTDEQQEVIVRELLHAVARVPRELQALSEKPSLVESERFTVRARFASLIVKGLDQNTTRDALVEIERDFRRLDADANATKASKQNKENRAKALDVDQLKKERLVRMVEVARRTLKRADAGTKNGRARHILRRLGSRSIWKTAGAFLAWAGRNHLDI
jgi:hypothetical protein